jgi:amino acid permease
MSFPWSYSVLGLVPGIIVTVVIAALVLYTSLVLWEFCLRHPEVRDICDIGQMLFWGKKWAWWITAFMFIMNNTFIQVSKDLCQSIHKTYISRVSTSL